MESSSIVQQGIAAFKAGDKAEAIRLFSEAIKQAANDIDAWLYLGAALDDPARKRQAFERVLKIDPNNDKAKNALARLGAAEGQQPAAAGASGSAASSSKNTSSSGGTGSSAGSMAGPIHFNLKLPVKIDGAPPTLTSEYCIENGRHRILQVWDIFRNQNTSAHVAAAEGVTLWDSVFVIGIGVVAAAAGEVFRLFGYLFDGEMFRHFPFSILGVLLLTIFAIVVTAVATGGAFAASVFASEWYLKSQGVTVVPTQHRMYLALAFLPFLLTSAIVGALSNSIGRVICLGPIGLIPLLVVIYAAYLLMKLFDQVYGGKEQNRGVITAAITMAAGWFASIVIGIVFAVISVILTAAFRLF